MTLFGVGPTALVVALCAAVITTALAGGGRPRAAGWAFGVAFAGLSVALVALGEALVTNDGSLVYVADNTSRATSWPYRLAGLWGGMEGSLLLWTWMSAGWTVAAGWSVRRRLPALAPGVQAVLAAGVSVFCGLLVVVSRPFDQLAVPAIDGGGLNPVLLHPTMLYHPPLLYAGAVGLAVPFALALAGLRASIAGARWLPLAVRSAQISLVLLSAGLLAGAHWAYVELGWGGYWAWDPVENGGLLPWLAAVAFLHAAVGARRSAGPATPAAALAALAFSLGLLGSFLTRSGAGESVHAFAQAPTVGWVLAAALAVAVVASAVVVFRAVRGARQPPVAPISKRGAIAANNLLLVGLAVVIGFGTVFPVVARWATGDRVVVTGRYFAMVATPLAVVILALIGLGPRLRWGATTDLRRRAAPAGFGLLAAAVAGAWFAERRPVAVVMVGLAGAAAALTVAGWRRQRGARWPLSHLGVAVLLAGVAGTTTGAHVTATLAPGEQVTVRGWTLRLERVVPVPPGPVPGGRALEAWVALDRNGRRLRDLRPVALVSDVGQRVSVAALRSTPPTDVQVALRSVGDGGVAVLEVSVLPLMQLVWWGGLLIVAGLATGMRRGEDEHRPGVDEPVATIAPLRPRSVVPG